MMQLTAEDKGDYLHVAMGVHAKAVARLHIVLIDDAKSSEAHVQGIIVIGERKRMRGL